MLADLELGAIDYGVTAPPIEPGSDWYALATAEANLHGITAQNIRLADADITPVTAIGDKLEEWRLSVGTTEVRPTGSRGRVIVETTGSASVTEGEQLTHANGNRYEVLETYIGVQNNDEIEVQAVDTGEETNLDPGEVLSFIGTIVNVRKQVTVSTTEPLQGGLSTESDERKRARILNDLQTQPGGGNWGHLRKLALESSPAVQQAYVYPALGGPSSAKVVVTQAFNPKIRDFTRSPSDTLVEIVRQAIHVGTAEEKGAPDMMEIVVQGVADQTFSMSLKVDIPDSVLSGGDGSGWLDSTPWPDLDGDTYVAVSSVTDSKTIVVNALTSTAPVAGQTRIVWWSPTDQAFVRRLVVSQSGSSGAWTLGLDQPLAASDGTLVAAGDFISPAAANSDAYGKTWREVLETIGVGENTSDSNRTPRASRHPYTDTQDSPNLNASQTRKFQNAHEEIQDISYSYREKTGPDVPAAVSTAPNVLVLDNFGIYQL